MGGMALLNPGGMGPPASSICAASSSTQRSTIATKEPGRSASWRGRSVVCLHDGAMSARAEGTSRVDEILTQWEHMLKE